MSHRFNPIEKGFPVTKALFSMGAYLHRDPVVEQPLLHLIYLRVSQINGCAFCIDMHSKDLLAMGESAQRLLLLDAWRETGLYSDRERAAFAWAEAITRLQDREVPDDVYEEAREIFSEEELTELTFAAMVINSYNRFNIAFQITGGNYVPGMFNAKAAV
ncbi:carboxymuconolactone decarboxylase family protein [Chitinophaga sp. NPDC101104]|uniref:carboxymuconolactone decarboxylase family protein n=1 Tax=Chitinophaga sp. NPDC101104 TaxID=3390561 RepID=UPI003D0779DB